MPTFFVASGAVTPPVVRIDGPLLSHLRESLRVQPGETVLITDDRGLRYRTEITAVGRHGIECRILEMSHAPPRKSPSLVLVQALLKGEKMDWVVQKATELGADRIVPVQTKHAVARIHRDRVEHQRARWERIALEAAQQSERWTVPTIDVPSDLSDATTADTSTVRLVLTERTAEESLTQTPLPKTAEESLTLFIGPEGGWDESELEFLKGHGCRTATLGTSILRAETAALTALAVVQSRVGVLG
ncbi:MAG TPA: 16S rRNA (uracil(1498)-N(3))-methyltransferase [Nitrospira sp.]|nr:16S rRNA (uracil(1498)-N(3))-methyltransferase [Nitrospira sp.]